LQIRCLCLPQELQRTLFRTTIDPTIHAAGDRPALAAMLASRAMLEICG
jgi:hypothetical protein